MDWPDQQEQLRPMCGALAVMQRPTNSDADDYCKTTLHNRILSNKR